MYIYFALYLYCNIVYTQRMPETGVVCPTYANEANSLSAFCPMALSFSLFLCVSVCVCTKYHSRYHWHQTRAPQPVSQPASLGILINNYTNKMASEMLLTQFKKVSSACRRSTVIFFSLSARHLNTLLDCSVIRLVGWGKQFFFQVDLFKVHFIERERDYVNEKTWFLRLF